MFIAVPVGMNYRTERLPLVTFSLIGLNTLVWLVTMICSYSTQGESDDWIQAHLWLVPEQSDWWTYLTSMFVHSGAFHLLGNMIFLFLFGACVEDLIGRLRFTIFYLVSGLVAEFVFIAMTPDHFLSARPMGGASGAISGCMGMYLLLRARADIEFKYIFWFFFVKAGDFVIPAWVAISFWFLKDLLSAVLGMVYARQGGGVAFGAHVGGFLGGLALAALYKGLIPPSEPVEDYDRRIIKPERIRVTLPPQPAVSAPETPTIFLHDGAEQTGPFTLTQVQAKLRHGQIGREARYWSDDMDDWQDVVELADQPIA